MNNITVYPNLKMAFQTGKLNYIIKMDWWYLKEI